MTLLSSDVMTFNSNTLSHIYYTTTYLVWSEDSISCYELTLNQKFGQLTRTSDQRLTGDEERPQTAPEWGRRKRREEEDEGRRSVYFFLLNRLKRFSLSFSRLPGLDSAAAVATEAGSVWARAPGAGVLWLLGVTSVLSPDMAAVMAEIHVFISSWRTERSREGGGEQLVVTVSYWRVISGYYSCQSELFTELPPHVADHKYSKMII